MGGNPSYFWIYGDPSRPVEQVSWNTIQGYLSTTGFRLPTEAEWEYACRAGTQTPFYNGSTDDNSLETLAWFSPHSGDQTRSVGGKLANGLGLHDMLGNVWEWVNDWYGDYTSLAQVNPTGPVNASERVFRGASWNNFNDAVRSSYRIMRPPGFSSYNLGFRVVRNP
jgi:formylglycine-generating enzyme required for sulfatase activity